MTKPRIFSGIQPSGNLHIGNYLGAIKNWVEMYENYDSIFCVVDLHAITVPQDPGELKKKIIELAKIYLAAGVDPKKAIIFVQSQVPQHTELMWILNTIAKTGELFKMTQFKDKAGIVETKRIEEKFKDEIQKSLSSSNKSFTQLKNAGNELNKAENSLKKIKNLRSALDYAKKLLGYSSELLRSTLELNSSSRHSVEVMKELLEMKIERDKKEKTDFGLMSYPILMAADILLYNTNIVPVGEDQAQHVEFSRTLAQRFNNLFGETFVVPKVHLKKEGMRIMGLDDPTKKMSKSAVSDYNRINLNDSPEKIKEKIKKAVTDSEQTIVYDEKRQGLKNLIDIYSLVVDKTAEEIVKIYQGRGYKDFKEDLAGALIEFLKPFQERFKGISDEEVKTVLKKGAQEAGVIAEEKIELVRKKLGLGI